MDFLKLIRSLDVPPHEGMSWLVPCPAPYPAPYGADGFARWIGDKRRPDRGAGEAGGRFQRRGASRRCYPTGTIVACAIAQRRGSSPSPSTQTSARTIAWRLPALTTLPFARR